jgi:hypothetical protein
LRSKVLLMLVSVSWLACTRAVVSAPDAGAAVVPRDAGAQSGPPLITLAQLDGYARYQKATISVYEQLFRDLERAGGGAHARDAGAAALAAVRVVEVRALAEERARKESGLSEADLAWIEPMVIDIVAARSLARSLDAQAQISELEAMKGELQGDVREGIEQTVEELKAQQAEGLRLSEQRARYGDANVDRVLGREEELTRAYEQWLARMTGGK